MKFPFIESFEYYKNIPTANNTYINPENSLSDILKINYKKNVLQD
jgi:hypothetical protein